MEALRRPTEDPRGDGSSSCVVTHAFDTPSDAGDASPGCATSPTRRPAFRASRAMARSRTATSERSQRPRPCDARPYRRAGAAAGVDGVWISPHRGRPPSGHRPRPARAASSTATTTRGRPSATRTSSIRSSTSRASLPRIRRAVRRDLALPGLPKERVLAAVVQVMDKTFVRVGGEKYRRENGSLGITTLRGRNVRARGTRVRFDFLGKSGKRHQPRGRGSGPWHASSGAVSTFPGYNLFQYEHDDGPRIVSAADVNDYLRAIAGRAFSSKDFRTWGGTVRAASALAPLRAARLAARGQGGRARGDRVRRGGARQHARRVPTQLRASAGARMRGPKALDATPVALRGLRARRAGDARDARRGARRGEACVARRTCAGVPRWRARRARGDAGVVRGRRGMLDTKASG